MRTRAWVLCAVLVVVGSCPREKPRQPLARRVAMPVFSEEELRRADSLRIVAATPVGVLEKTEEASEILVTFDDAMVSLGEVSEEENFPLLLDPEVPGFCDWLSPNTVVFRPATVLPTATRFKVKIPRGVRSLSGRMLKQDYEFEFETVRPSLEYSVPFHGAEFVTLKPNIWLHFNMPMDPKRAQKFLQLVAGDGTRVPFRLRHPRPKERTEDAWWYEPEKLSSVLVLTSKVQLRKQTQYQIILAEGLLAAEGNLGLEKERRIEFRTFNHFRLERLERASAHHPEDPLVFVFSNPVAQEELLRHVKFSPPVKLPRYEYDFATTQQYLYVELAPETQYEVILSRQLTDRFGNRLGKDVRLRLKTVSYRPALGMPVGLGIVESATELRHPVWMVNVESVKVRMRRLEAGEVIPFWRKRYEGHGEEEKEKPGELERIWQTGFNYQTVWRPKLVRNRRTLLPLDIAPGLGGRKSGFLFCELDMLHQPERGARYRRAFLQVSPFGLTAKFSPENGLGYVTRLVDGAPVAGVTVELRDDANRSVWTGRTDKNGFVVFPGWAMLGVKARSEWDSPRLWMFVREPGGEGFVHSEWGTGIHPYELGVSYDWSPDPTEPSGFIYTEKGLYKQADTVRIKGIIRHKQRGRWIIPSRRDGLVRVTDSRDEEIFTRRVRLSDWGSFDISLPLGAEAFTGYYSIVFSQGEHEFYGHFRVEAYRPAEFEVTVKGDKDSYVAGDMFTAHINARYLFGAQMAGEQVDWTVSLEPTSFSPPGYEGFSWGAYMDETEQAISLLSSGSGKLDVQGHLQVQTKLNLGRRLSSCRVTCEATVTATNQRSITGRESYIVHRAERYVGVKMTRGMVELGDSVGLDLVAAFPDGRPASGENVTVTVFRRIWRSARKAQTGGRYSWLSEKVDEKVATFEVRTESEAVRKWFRPDKPGQYWCKCEMRDRRNNTARTDLEFWVAGKGEAAWMIRDDDLIELVRDKNAYKPGDTAKILVKSPWTGVKAMVTVERELVLDYFGTEISGNADLIRIPIKEEYLPNVFVSVVLLKGRTAYNSFGDEGQDLGKPGFKIGYVELPVDPEAKKLTVVVKTGRTEYQPGQEVEIDLQVLDKKGRGVRSEVSLAVVDLGVLKLVGYRTPDPFSMFYASRSLSVVTAESRLHVIGQRNYGEKGEAAGGGGLDGVGLDGGYDYAYRQKFLETALWIPSLRSDENGRARVRFRVPDNLTTWQIMAVAATVDKFGSGESKFQTNKPLLLVSSLPRFIRPEDRFSAGVMVHNRTDKKMKVTVKATAAKGVRIDGSTSRQVEVEPNRPVEVVFDYLCIGAGEAEFTFEASGEGARDRLRVTLPAIPSVVSEAVALYEQTMDSVIQQTVSVPPDVFAGVGGLEVAVSSSGLTGLERGLEFLRTYPYECLEQRMSKILPFIVGEDVINQFGLSELRGSALRKFVQAELDVVSRYQDESGGFYFWPDLESYAYEKPSPWLSAYTMYVLALAEKKGFQVASRVSERGKSYLTNWLNYGKRGTDWPYSTDEYLTARSLAVYAIALWGEKVESHLPFLLDQVDQMSVYGKAYLLKTLALLPKSVYAEARSNLIRAMNNKLKLEPTMAHYEEEREGGWLFHSDVRTTAVVLQALLEHQGQIEFAEKIVRWLIAERRVGRWRTTQENACVFDALATFYRTYEKERPNFRASVRIAGKDVLSAVFSGRSLKTARRFLPIDSLAKTTLPVNISRKGQGRMYYGLRLYYARKGELKAKDQGFRVEKVIRPVGKVSGYVRGAEYIITLKVHTAQDRIFVVLDDPLPAGWEIVNTSFATERQTQPLSTKSNKQWWGGFNYEETYHDRYLLVATYLTKGVHTETYRVRALTSGRFFLPPTRVEEMYTPEVFGHTGQQYLEIK